MADTPAAKPFPIPLSYFGIALGTAGLGMSWRYAATVGQAPAWPGEGLLALAGVVWLLLMLAWFTKFLAFRQAFRADFQDLAKTPAAKAARTPQANRPFRTNGCNSTCRPTTPS